MSKNDDALRCADALNLEVMDYALKYDTALNAQHYIRSLVAENEAKDALLRQAEDTMEGLFGIPDQWTGAGGGGVAVWRMGGIEPVRETIAAIRQHLEGRA